MKTVLRIAASTVLGIGLLLSPVTARAGVTVANMGCNAAPYQRAVWVGALALDSVGWVYYTPSLLWQDASSPSGWRSLSSKTYFETQTYLDHGRLQKDYYQCRDSSCTSRTVADQDVVANWGIRPDFHGPVWVRFTYLTYTGARWQGPYSYDVGGGSGCGF